MARLIQTTVGLLAGCLSGGILTVAAQQAGIGRSKGFVHSEPHDAPHQDKQKFLLKLNEFQLASGGRYVGKGVSFETFRVDGKRELQVNSPEGIFDPTTSSIRSDGPIEMILSDGELAIEGVGYVWNTKDSLLTISNEVRAVVRRERTNPPAAGAEAPLVITSRQFEFDMQKRRAVFRQDVRGIDPRVEFACGLLAVRAPPESDSFDVIEAEQGVVLIAKADAREARAQRAIYTRADELIQLSGDAFWRQGRQEGRADSFVIHRIDQSIAADGHVALKFPRASLGVGGFFLSSTNAATPADAGDSPLVDLFADRFQSRSNYIVAEGSVRVVDATNQLACDKLSVQSAVKGASDEEAVAEGNVVVSQGDDRIRANRAVYTKAADTIVFTGRPEWKLEQSEGRADQVTIRSQSGEVHSTGNVEVKVPLGVQGSSFLTLFPASTETNISPKVIEVYAREFRAKGRQVIFSGDTHAHEAPITGSEPRLRSDTMEVHFAADTRRTERVVARGNVVFEEGTVGVTNGPNVYRKVTARSLTARSSAETGRLADLTVEGSVRIEQPGNLASGEHAVYDAAKDVLVLTGKPALETPEVIITEARELIYDRAANRFRATAPCMIRLVERAVKSAVAGQGALR